MSEPIRTGDFWAGPLEAATYLEAVRLNSKREDEGAWSYCARISGIVTADPGAVEAAALERQQQSGRHYEEPVE